MENPKKQVINDQDKVTTLQKEVPRCPSALPENNEEGGGGRRGGTLSFAPPPFPRQGGGTHSHPHRLLSDDDADRNGTINSDEVGGRWWETPGRPRLGGEGGGSVGVGWIPAPPPPPSGGAPPKRERHKHPGETLV